MSEEEKPVSNYVVTTQGWTGKHVTHCETEDEVWEALGKASFGAMYSVTSPKGLPTDQFIPF